MNGQTPAGWFQDPQDDSQVRYWDGNQWTDNRAPRTPQAPMAAPGGVATAPPPPAPAVAEPSKKNWFLRHKVLSGLLALVVIIFIAVAASGGGGGGGSDNAGGAQSHSTKNKPSSKPSTHSNNSGKSTQGSSAYGTAKLPLQNGDWRLDSIQVKNDGLGDFGGTARITYTGKDSTGGDNLFTVTVFKGKKVVATLNGAANSVKPGTTATVQLISSDKYVPGLYKYDFQNDL